MADYIVSIDHEESNELANNLSITGRVNKIQCAIVIRLSSIKDLSKQKAKAVKQRALIEAFYKMQESVAESDGDKVTVE